MLAYTLWSRRLLRIRLATLLSGLLALGLLSLGVQGVSATSLVPASDMPAEEDAGEPDPLRAALAATGAPLTAGQILFIEENLPLPGYRAGALIPDDDSTGGSSANPTRDHDEIKFLHDNWVFDSREPAPDERPSTVRPPESETSTVWPGISDLMLIDEPNLHHLVPPDATSIDESDLWLLEEPGMQRYHGREGSALRTQNLAEFDAMEQAPSLYTEVSKQHTSTHPWGGDALTSDY